MAAYTYGELFSQVFGERAERTPTFAIRTTQAPQDADDDGSGVSDAVPDEFNEKDYKLNPELFFYNKELKAWVPTAAYLDRTAGIMEMAAERVKREVCGEEEKLKMFGKSPWFGSHTSTAHTASYTSTKFCSDAVDGLLQLFKVRRLHMFFEVRAVPMDERLRARSLSRADGLQVPRERQESGGAHVRVPGAHAVQLPAALPARWDDQLPGVRVCVSVPRDVSARAAHSAGQITRSRAARSGEPQLSHHDMRKFKKLQWILERKDYLDNMPSEAEWEDEVCGLLAGAVRASAPHVIDCAAQEDEGAVRGHGEAVPGRQGGPRRSAEEGNRCEGGACG